MKRHGYLCLVITLGCAGSEPLEVPRCSLPTARVSASEACVATLEFSEYQERVAHALAGELRWQHTQSLPVGVELDAQSRVQRVCVDAEVQLPWSLRRQLARSNESMRTLAAGPSCLAGAHLDLTPALVQISSETTRARDTAALGSCLALRDSACVVQDAPVCGVFPDDTRRTYRNACSACESHSVQGWLEGPCPLSPKP